MRSPGVLAVGDHLALQVADLDVVAVVGELMMSGITTIVISSTAARPPMPWRLATSPSKWVGLTLSGSIDGADSV